MNACKACNFQTTDDFNVGENINNTGDDFVIIRSDENSKVTYDLAADIDNHFYTLEINYCPMCGRKLR